MIPKGLNFFREKHDFNYILFYFNTQYTTTTQQQEKEKKNVWLKYFSTLPS
jgi:hypothetical protein